MVQLNLTQWYGRLGNNIIQLVYALAFVEHTQSRLLISAPLGGLLRFVPPEFDFRIDKETSREVTGNFFPTARGQTFIAQTVASYGTLPFEGDCLWRVASQYLGESFLKAIGPLTPLPSTTLVIHIRSGDIFRQGGHSHMRQPPLIFYKKIIEENDFTEVIVVTEQDRSNPCVAALQQWRRELVRIQTASVEQDIATLLSARNLVIGVGTFAYSSLMVGHRHSPLEHLHVWNNGMPEAPYNCLPQEPHFHIHIYSTTDWGASWQNLPQQRRQLLEHSKPICKITQAPRYVEHEDSERKKDFKLLAK